MHPADRAHQYQRPLPLALGPRGHDWFVAACSCGWRSATAFPTSRQAARSFAAHRSQVARQRSSSVPPQKRDSDEQAEHDDSGRDRDRHAVSGESGDL